MDYIVLKDRLEPVPERRRIHEQLKLIVARARRTDKIRGILSSGMAAWEAYLHMLEHEDLSTLLLSDPIKDSVVVCAMGKPYHWQSERMAGHIL